MRLQFLPDPDAEAIAQEHRQWSRLYAQPQAAPTASARHVTESDPDRRLRVGYVSPDSKNHPVGRFLLPLIEHHDHQQFEVFCYSNSADFPDKITSQITNGAPIIGERF